MREVNIICIERNSNKVFEFPAQTLYSGNTHIYITRTLRHNQALTLFLHNCYVSLQLLQNLREEMYLDSPKEHFVVGQIPNILGSEIRVPMLQVEGLEEGIISFVYQRIESVEDRKLKNKPIVMFQNQILDVFQEDNKNNSLELMNFFDSNIANRSHDMLSIHHNLDEYDNNFLQNYNNFDDSYQQDGNQILEDQCKVEGQLELQDYYQSDLFPLEKSNSTKASVTENTFSSCNRHDNLPLGRQEIQKKLMKKPHKMDQKNMRNLNNNTNNINNLEEGGDFLFIAKSAPPRSKERTIISAIEIVSNWRDIYEQSKERRIFRDLQTIAQDLGFSKKVLDYYYLELRTAEFFGFEFNLHLDKKFGMIRRYNHAEKQVFLKNAPIAQKIPISNTLFYRIPSLERISHDSGISNSNEFDGDIKIEKCINQEYDREEIQK